MIKRIMPKFITKVWGTSTEYSIETPLSIDDVDKSIIIKRIVAETNLSLQVHPAISDLCSSAKHEMWYVSDVYEGASVICGFKNNTSHEEINRRIMDGSILDVTQSFRVNGGEWFYIKPGIIHSIQAGCTIWEIQNHIDVTYRLFDYDRKCRELHVQEGLNTLVYDLADCVIVPKQLLAESNNSVRVVDDCPLFSLEELKVNGEFRLTRTEKYRYLILVNGACTVNSLQANKNDVFALEHQSEIVLNGQGIVLIVS